MPEWPLKKNSKKQVGEKMKDCEQIKLLLMGLMDKELSPEERQVANTHLTRCQKCRDEYEELRKVSKNLDVVSFIEPDQEVLNNLWTAPFSRLVRNSALVLIIGGYMTLIGYGFYEFLQSDEPAFPKVAIAAIIFGFVFLLFSVIRERLITYKADPYKEVER